jgi:FixJ family two-component response regulator
MTVQGDTKQSSRILIVDDDPSFLTFVSAVFTAAAVHYEIATSGKGALERLASDRFGAALIDLRLPDIDGLELLARTRAMGRHLPVVLISGAGDIPSAVAAIRLGAAGFLEKPVSPSDLVDTVLAIVESARASDEMISTGVQFVVDSLLAIATSQSDVPSIDSWAHLVGASRAVVFNKCNRAHVGAKAVLDLGRLLRGVLLYAKTTLPLDSFLDSRDVRTVRGLLARAGFSPNAPTLSAPEDFLHQQRLLEHPVIIAATIRALTGTIHHKL